MGGPPGSNPAIKINRVRRTGSVVGESPSWSCRCQAFHGQVRCLGNTPYRSDPIGLYAEPAAGFIPGIWVHRTDTLERRLAKITEQRIRRESSRVLTN